MNLADLPIHRVKRIMTEKEADELVGTVVPDFEADQHGAGIWVDDDTDEPIFACFPMEEEVDVLRAAVLNIKYGSTLRVRTGMRNESRTFGMAPRKVHQRRESCRPTSLAGEQPDEHGVLVLFAKRFGEMLKEFAPEIYERDRTDLANQELADEWRMADDAMWTSGVVNKASTLPYHRDAFNFNTWSAMPVIRRGMGGGYLHLAEYGFTYSARDGWVCFFPGWKYVHGVTPMTPKTKDAYRYSVVYYALRGMKDCFTYAVETQKAKENRTARETLMAHEIKNGIKRKPGH